uniref:Dienelactone hydrolase domain-containing protein n=1 Tax=Aplanochytrium stocchinoi TaxID=215587 RepID=A0A7S3PQP2_9STRA|mmetsp:Transcript_5227/g.6586  ORF Transcript_5227/g.6586 Transcript_5227/m.6586 type:complete len:280 (+) Transcript_5227:30-869(+)|eukprot:CAMPEP_0204834838 /NCGR_PEP_ID=MMETSP1346-20131115/20911_1 /ASSEMBLY_ACC=CAM_ASM_000771 /TAXON_ID=215587 /ORGANISM="Aplanochytrium stocchinoi, Strain GSBS06" /LENGTH=279 /DNA_ID=CAMNT_0051968391 /DNA_START=421 /DNA_END=1260 /DNA_ORIENTATION=+
MGSSNSSNQPPPECCPPGSLPLADDAKSIGATKPLRGEIVRLGDDKIGTVRIYSTHPESEQVRGVVIAIHDIFGFGTSRTHHLCDELANEGYLVVAPCFYGEDLMPVSGWFSAFTNSRRALGRVRYPWAKVSPKLDLVMNYIKTETAYAELKVGLVGFCWGSWAVFHACASDQFSCGASFHPSLNLTLVHGESLQALCENVKSPQLLMPAFPDPGSVRENGKVINILRKKDFGDQCMVKDFSKQVNHGFANRGDLNKTKIATAYEEGMDLVKTFFKSHL